MKISFLLLYDLGRGENAVRLKINRELRKLGANMFQHSIWEHTNIHKLKEIADLIGNREGKS